MIPHCLFRNIIDSIFLVSIACREKHRPFIKLYLIKIVRVTEWNKLVDVFDWSKKLITEGVTNFSSVVC